VVKNVNVIRCPLINEKNDSEKTDIKRKSGKINKLATQVIVDQAANLHEDKIY
jgi:flagellar biosynthesis/type III secretory pathway M-ring protein FliF/YscJ